MNRIFPRMGALARLAVAFGMIGLVAACAEQDRPPKNTARVIDKSEGAGGLQTVEVLGGRQRYFVDIVDQGGGVRHLIVRAAGYRGFDRSEGDVAYDAAQRAGAVIDCGEGRGLRVLPDTALFIETDQSSGALARGQPVWRFKGRCGG